MLLMWLFVKCITTTKKYKKDSHTVFQYRYYITKGKQNRSCINEACLSATRTILL